ncbi:ribonuclease H-like domain-containing protein [Tanacetum coccineum]|uniref:Ribonuclease H-like domain-containing protein n=1 Tax=Tanacetum coccineum TaxID=301880 RepID=A0ABQ5C6A1_9ASTR
MVEGDNNISGSCNTSEASKLIYGDELYLHPNDSSITNFIRIKLKGTENYSIWNCAMTLALQTKKKIRFTDSTCKKLAEKSLANQWDLCNSVVLSWILGQFDAITKLPACSCAAQKAFKTHTDLIKLMQFLMRLDDVYQPIGSSLLTRDPIPDVKIDFLVISREESHREYTVNLLSVHKLARDSKLFIVFDEFKCYIQDLHLKKTLVTGSQHGGLYFLDFNNKPETFIKCNNMICYSNTLWNNRLGHPSDQVLKALKALKDRIDIRSNGDSAPCDICHEAKQTREPFPSCDHKTTNLGDIVHLDVWGPYKITSRDGYKYFLTVVDDYSRAPPSAAINFRFRKRGRHEKSPSKTRLLSTAATISTCHVRYNLQSLTAYGNNLGNVDNNLKVYTKSCGLKLLFCGWNLLLCRI